uniref:Sec1-like protein n=1 Tax=Ostreococcus mediterraneus TaxID=1486918 RepID=A0A7S0T968_9CHLO
MAAPSTPSRVAAAVARWTSSARSAAPFFARAVLVLDEDAARAMETSIGARALGETCEIVAACAVRDVVRDDGESADIYGFDGARVCDDAPVVMCFGRALARCAEDVERVARARARASRVVVFVGCDGGDAEEHAWTVAALTATCTRALAGGGEARVDGVEGELGDKAVTSVDVKDVEDGASDVASEEWGSWGDDDDDDNVEGDDRDARSAAFASASSLEHVSSGTRASAFFSIKFFPPLMYRALGSDSFVISSARMDEARERDALEFADAARGDDASSASSSSHVNRALAHHLAEIFAHWALAPDFFALGPNADAIARIAALAKPEAVGVDAEIPTESAAVILIDREMDLMTPSVDVGDGWLERVVSNSNSPSVILSPLLDDPRTVAMDDVLCRKNTRDGAMYIIKAMRDIAAREDARLDAKATPTTRMTDVADELRALINALDVDPSVALRHRAVLQRAKLTLASLTNANELKSTRQIIALQRLTAAAAEGGSGRVRDVATQILKMMYASGGTAVGHPLEAFALVLAAHVLAVEANACARGGIEPRATGAVVAEAFDAASSAAIRDAFISVLIASSAEEVDAQVPQLMTIAPGVREALETLRAVRGRAREPATPPRASNDGWDDDDGWGDDDDDKGDDGWGDVPSPDTNQKSIKYDDDEEDENVAEATRIIRDAVDVAFARLAGASAARGALKTTESRSLYANGMPVPNIVDVIARVKTNLDDQGVAANFSRVAGSLGGLLKNAAGASASIVSGAMGRLGSLITKVASAPKPSDHDIVVVFIVGAMTRGEFAVARAEAAPGVERALGARARTFIIGASDLAAPHACAVDAL